MTKLRTMPTTLKTIEHRRVSPPPKQVDTFYGSIEWRNLMKQIIAKRGRICEDRECDGKSHKPGMRVFGDHLVELRDGGAALDENNIMLRCGASHTRKTNRVRMERFGKAPE